MRYQNTKKQHTKQQHASRTTHKATTHEVGNALCEKSYNSTKRVSTARKELQQHKKINNSARKAIQLKKNDNDALLIPFVEST
jgi:hypothetical protein